MEEIKAFIRETSDKFDALRSEIDAMKNPHYQHKQT